MIVISPSRGDGGTTVGAAVSLFDGEYSGDVFQTYFQLSSGGSATGEEDTVVGPGSWTWLLSGSTSAFQVYCQPTTGSVEWGSAGTNTWLSLGSTRKWTRSWLSSRTVLAISIRDVATSTVRATCTITLTS